METLANGRVFVSKRWNGGQPLWSCCRSAAWPSACPRCIRTDQFGWLVQQKAAIARSSNH